MPEASMPLRHLKKLSCSQEFSELSCVRASKTPLSAHSMPWPPEPATLHPLLSVSRASPT
eukprot:4205810-Amphidinium_carterae.1